MLLNLLKNEDFRNSFINCFSDLTNTIFKKDSLLKTIGEIKSRIEPEIRRHFTRWNTNPDKWYGNVSILEKFASNRQPYFQQNFMTKFNLKGTANLELSIKDPGSGKIQLNSIEVREFPWKGNYFTGVPVTLTAMPNPGYKFKEWQGITEVKSNPAVTVLSSDISVAAVFEQDSNFYNIVINEINYNSSAGFDAEDWIELYNASSSDQSLSGWIFKDEDDQHSFIFPTNTLLKRNDYLVLCRDTAKFSSLFPEIKNKIGNFDFGLNNAGELICLFDNNHIIIDSLTFDDNSPWPNEADGSGKTLELKNPALDNSNPLSWSASLNHGSPGKQNSQYTEVKIIDSSIPGDFILFQNYPNPFNQQTTVKYALPVESHVKIKIFNTLGRQIKELINTEQNAGYHELIFDASGTASGVYFLMIEAQAANGSKYFHDVRKMLVLK
jgi:hypothetical protein